MTRDYGDGDNGLGRWQGKDLRNAPQENRGTSKKVKM